MQDPDSQGNQAAVGETGFKIITDETFISVKIIKATKTIFRHVISDLPRIKMHFDCEMSRSDYDFLKELTNKEIPYTVSFTEDLVPLGVDEFIPPFDAQTIYISGQYDGMNYKTNPYINQI